MVSITARSVLLRCGMGVPSELLVPDLFAPALPQLSCKKKQDAGRYDKKGGQAAPDHVHEERCGLVPARRLGWVRSVLGIRLKAILHSTILAQ